MKVQWIVAAGLALVLAVVWTATTARADNIYIHDTTEGNSTVTTDSDRVGALVTTFSGPETVDFIFNTTVPVAEGEQGTFIFDMVEPDNHDLVSDRLILTLTLGTTQVQGTFLSDPTFEPNASSPPINPIVEDGSMQHIIDYVFVGGATSGQVIDSYFVQSDLEAVPLPSTASAGVIVLLALGGVRMATRRRNVTQTA